MLLERTISQLDIGPVPPEEAAELGQLGYLQWLASLDADVGYTQAAIQAFEMAHPFAQLSPAVAVFCELLAASMRVPIEPLPLTMPIRTRRGGAQTRRLRRTIH